MTDRYKKNEEAREWISEHYGDGQEIWCDPIAIKESIENLREENKRLREVLSELLALVISECPSLLNEDSGGDARLYLTCKSALRGDI